MIIGIVGHEASKFTLDTEGRARIIITKLLLEMGVSGYSSGHCHLGGVDIWAEEIGIRFHIPAYIYPPKVRAWPGYRERNIQIAQKSDAVHVIVVKELPEGYNGMRFRSCYHCHTDTHIKSGACWTALYAQKLGKSAYWHII